MENLISKDYEKLNLRDSEGLLHSEDSPSFFLKNYESWNFHGKWHRTDGPARIHYYPGTKQIYSAEYWIMDEGYNTKEEWFNALTAEQQENYIWKM